MLPVLLKEREKERNGGKCRVYRRGFSERREIRRGAAIFGLFSLLISFSEFFIISNIFGQS